MSENASSRKHQSKRDAQSKKFQTFSKKFQFSAQTLSTDFFPKYFSANCYSKDKV